MASARKKVIRDAFRVAVFERDGHRCVVCRSRGVDTPAVDAHHITDRNEMPGGGYVLENGVSVCEACHLLVEEFHVTGVAFPGLAPEDLYRLIGSSPEAARRASEKLP